MDASVRVVCRIRPQNKIEDSRGGRTCVLSTKDSIAIADESGGRNNFTFDAVWNPGSQREIFEEVGNPIIADVMKGYNATIFAYGQTSAGKTHTMQGPNLMDSDQKGLIPRACDAIFASVFEADSHLEFAVKVGYIEIYMERIRDLLNPAESNLQIREDPIHGIYVDKMHEEYVTSPDEMLTIMNYGAKNRAVAATGMNEGSSRSHSVFCVTVEQTDTRTEARKKGKLYLVDLAGSEMVGKTGASGMQLKEAQMINKSLSALGQVIKALTTEKAKHVPYRDSKLTRVLQESLGGNARTLLVICVSPSSYNEPETVSTCRFGQRAKQIKNTVRVNATMSTEEYKVRLEAAERTIAQQQEQIATLLASGDIEVPPPGTDVAESDPMARDLVLSRSRSLSVVELSNKLMEAERDVLAYKETCEETLLELENVNNLLNIRDGELAAAEEVVRGRELALVAAVEAQKAAETELSRMKDAQGLATKSQLKFLSGILQTLNLSEDAAEAQLCDGDAATSRALQEKVLFTVQDVLLQAEAAVSERAFLQKELDSMTIGSSLSSPMMSPHADGRRTSGSPGLSASLPTPPKLEALPPLRVSDEPVVRVSDVSRLICEITGIDLARPGDVGGAESTEFMPRLRASLQGLAAEATRVAEATERQHKADLVSALSELTVEIDHASELDWNKLIMETRSKLRALRTGLADTSTSLLKSEAEIEKLRKRSKDDLLSLIEVLRIDAAEAANRAWPGLVDFARDKFKWVAGELASLAALQASLAKVTAESKSGISVLQAAQEQRQVAQDEAASKALQVATLERRVAELKVSALEAQSMYDKLALEHAEVTKSLASQARDAEGSQKAMLVSISSRDEMVAELRRQLAEVRSGPAGLGDRGTSASLASDMESLLLQNANLTADLTSLTQHSNENTIMMNGELQSLKLQLETRSETVAALSREAEELKASLRDTVSRCSAALSSQDIAEAECSALNAKVFELQRLLTQRIEAETVSSVPHETSELSEVAEPGSEVRVLRLQLEENLEQIATMRQLLSQANALLDAKEGERQAATHNLESALRELTLARGESVDAVATLQASRDLLAASLEDKVEQIDSLTAETAAMQERMRSERRKLEQVIEELKEEVVTLKADIKRGQATVAAEVRRPVDGASGQAGLQKELAEQRANAKSIEKNLQHLVNVHRQLLRKYASLELESADCRKRVTARDERISQLELNAKTRTANMRAQADIHSQEIARIHTEHQEQLKALAGSLARESMAGVIATGSAPDSKIKRVIRGGSGKEPLTAMTDSGAAGAFISSAPDAKSERNLFSRLFFTG